MCCRSVVNTGYWIEIGGKLVDPQKNKVLMELESRKINLNDAVNLVKTYIDDLNLHDKPNPANLQQLKNKKLSFSLESL